MANEQQIKAQQAINSGTLKQKDIVVNRAQDKHIQVKQGEAYQIILQNKNKVSETDFDVIAKKAGDDLILLLDDATTLTFDDYFAACADLSCVVSLPADGGLYHIVSKESVVLTDGSEVVYAYGDKTALQAIASGESALLQFLGQPNVNPESSWSLLTIGGGILAIAAAAGGGGSSGGDDNSTKFTISGNISAGQVIEGHDLKLTVYNENNEALNFDDYKATIEDDGSYSIDIKKEYTEYLTVKVNSAGTKKDYLDEADGDETNLSVELRTIVKAKDAKNIIAMVNPLTEIITRETLGDKTELKEVDDIAANLSKANTAVSKAFNADGVDINSTEPALVNTTNYNNSASAGAKALGQALAGISGMEIKDQDGDATKSTEEVLSALVTAIDGNGVMAEDTKADFLAGLNVAADLKDEDNKDANTLSDGYINQFVTSITQIKISDDKDQSGNDDTDSITRTKNQDITATLKTALSAQKLWGSVDSGVHWTDITNQVTNNVDISWNTDLKEGDKEGYTIQFAITADTATSVNNTQDNITLHSYTLDTTAAKAATIDRVITTGSEDLGNKITSDATPKIRVSFSIDDDIDSNNAKLNDKIEVMVDSGTGSDAGYQSSKKVTLEAADIGRGWKEITLSALDNDGDDNKEYKYKVKIIDQVGNESDLSNEYKITFDGEVEKLTLQLKEDTGVDASDNITSNNTIIIGNIEKGASVSYKLDDGKGWQEIDLDTNSTYDRDAGTVEIDLDADTEYGIEKIEVKQTDDAGNKAETKNSRKWIIDNTSAKHDATDVDKFNFIKVYDNDNSDVVEEVIISLTFDENIILGTDFDKNSFTVHVNAIGDSVLEPIGIDPIERNAIKPINSVEVNGKEVKIHMLGNITSSGISLSYAQTANDKALQDKAGNIVAAFSKIVYAIDNNRPGKVSITKAITDDNNNLSSGETTKDQTIDVRISLKDDSTSPAVDSGAKKDDKIQVMKKGDNGNYGHVKYVTLSAADISLGYKDVSLGLSKTGDDNKNHEFKARVIDETGNKGVYSTDFSIIYDNFVESLELRLAEDTGAGRGDGVTNNKEIIVDKIERGATVKYTLNRGNIWKTIDAGSNEITYSSSNDKTGELKINLNGNTEYAAGDIIVRQTDEAGNSEETSNPKWKIDNTAIKYDATEDVKILRQENADKNGFESHIILTFTENVVKSLNFNKDFFNIFLVVNGVKVKSTIDSIKDSVDLGNPISNKIEIVIKEDIQTASTNKLTLSYIKTGSGADQQKQALQDEAGNLLEDIGGSAGIELTFDKVKPGKLEITSLIDNRDSKGNGVGEVGENAISITDDRTLTVKVEFSGTTVAGSAAEKGDLLRYYSKDNNEDVLIEFFTLTEEDIRLGYKETTFSAPNNSEEAKHIGDSVEGKYYELSATLTDATGNISVNSNVKKFTIDTHVAQATIKLRNDSSATGASNTDKKTKDELIEVSNIEKGAVWEYSTDGGDNWSSGGDDGKQTSDDSNLSDLQNALKDKYYFALEQNKTYVNNDIQVRQTDRAGNTNGDDGHSSIALFGNVVTDNIQPEYESLRISGNEIVLSFSENLYTYSTSGTTDSDVTNAFKVKVKGDDNIVSKVVYKDGEVTLLMEKNVNDGDIVHVTYIKPTGGDLEIGYRLKDNVGNEVDNFKVGGSGADTLNGDDDINDKIFGEGGNDTLTSGGGNDTLIGGSGNDTLTGGVGSDTFDYNAITDGNDTITDFTIGSGGDKLDFKDLLLGYDSTSNLANFLSVTDAGNGNGVTIAVDANGDGNGTDLSVTLSGIGTGGLTLASFEADNLIVL